MAKNKAFDWDYFDFNKNKPQEFLNNPAKYIENNFRNLFGKEYNKENLINLVSEEWDDYTDPKEFRTAKRMMKESGDLDIFYRDLEQRGITEEIALTEGHHNIRKRFIGRSYEDSNKKYLAEQNYKVHRGSRTIDVSLQDSMMNLKFDNPEDFNILNNAIEFNNSTYEGWKSYNYNKENKQLIKDAPTFFDHYANNLKKEGDYTERYITNYLNDIQKKAEEFGYNIDLQGIINERKVQAQAEKSFIHESNAMNREYRVKQDRINQIEEEMKKFKHDSPEYKALELERNNIEVSLRDWKGTHQTLELPPPREGAPMFEGGAVPSVIANNSEYGVNYNINMNASSQSSSFSFDNMRAGDNFVDANGNSYIYKGMSEKEPSLGIDNDVYHFIDMSSGNQRNFMNKGAMERTFNKVDNVLSLEDAEKFNTARNAFMNQSKSLNDLSAKDLTMAEYDLMRKDYFNKWVIPAKEEFDKQYQNIKSKNKNAISFTDKEKQYINDFNKSQQYFENLQVNNASQQTQRTKNNQNRTRINKNAAADNEEAINNLFNINPNNTGNSYSYDIPDEPDINQKEVDSFMERIFGSKDFDLRKASQSDINYWSNFTAKDIKDIFIFPSDFSNQDTLDEISRRIDDIAEVSEAYKLTDKFMENNFGSKDFDITQDKDPSAWANLTDDDLEYAYESLLPDDNKSAREMILERLKTIRDDAQNLVNNQTSSPNGGANFNQTNYNTNNTNTNTNSGGGSSSASGGGSNSGGSSSGGGSSNSTGGSSSSTKTHIYKRNGKMRQLSNGSSKYSANTKFKVNTNSGHLPRTSNKAVKTIGTMSALNTVFNVAGAVSDYKNARREGKGVVGATLKAGAEFALGEMLGLKGQLALFAVRAIPSAAIAGADMLYKESRRMNSAANQGVFGNAQFQDTQQLATMRQSGMEMAKMANYNLQQTLMGNEATYFHR